MGGDGKAASKVHFFDAGGCTGGLSGDVAGGGVLSRDVKEEHTRRRRRRASLPAQAMSHRVNLKQIVGMDPRDLSQTVAGNLHVKD